MKTPQEIQDEMIFQLISIYGPSLNTYAGSTINYMTSEFATYMYNIRAELLVLVEQGKVHCDDLTSLDKVLETGIHIPVNVVEHSVRPK
jgi:hypothetical protein